MTKRIMLINETDDESRVAIVEDNLLQEMLIEHRTVEQTKNNIYKGTVVQVQSSLQAAFVDFGNKKHGFLPSSEINSSIYQRKNLNSSSPIQQKLKKGQTILVQVTREAVDQKGAALTTNISLPGRFMVLMPNSSKGGISKKIENSEERDRLKSFIAAIDAEKHSVIIRTAGVGRDLVELKKDYTTLKKTWEEILRSFKEMKKPGLILEEPDVVTRTLRDYYTEDIEEVWVDNPETFQKALGFLKQSAPRRQKDLKLFVGDRSLFSSYKIERQVEQLTSRDVKLSSGGSIVIDQTEALVAIDVNSGKSNQEGDIDATALRTNLEAAREVARQLRLRNLGGLIVIDFIDMETEKSRRKVEEELQNAMSRDKAQRKFNPISQFGLLELSRQRLSVGISATIESVCPVCNGKGRIPSLLASTNLILRSIRETAARGNLVQIEGVLPLELANHLLNERRQSITDLELEFGIDIILRGDPKVTVFNENQLKSTFIQKKQHGRGDTDNRKDDDRKRSQQKEREQSRKADEPEKQIESIDKGDEPEKQKASVEKKVDKKEVVAKPEKQQTFETGKTEDRVPEKQEKKHTAVDDSNASEPVPIEEIEGGIHPGALFSNVKEIESDELAVITSSFENRLKGKPDNQPNPIIDRKYLWKSATVEAEPAGAAQNPEKPEEETVGEMGTLKEDGTAGVDLEPATQKTGETMREDAAGVTAAAKTGDQKKASGRKKSRKKPAKKSTQKETELKSSDKESASAQSNRSEEEEPAQNKSTAVDADAAENAEAKSPATSRKSTGSSRSSRSRKSASKKTAEKKAAASATEQAEKSEAGRKSASKQKSRSASKTTKQSSAKKEAAEKGKEGKTASAKKTEKPVKAKRPVSKTKKEKKAEVEADKG